MAQQWAVWLAGTTEEVWAALWVDQQVEQWAICCDDLSHRYLYYISYTYIRTYTYSYVH